MRGSKSSSPLRRRRPSVARLDIHVGYWVRYVAKEFSHALGRRLEHKGVSLAEWIVLRQLYEGDRRPAALAAELGLTRGTISRLAARLVACLMITQETTTEDGRGQMLALTGLGRSTVEVLAGIVDAADEDFFGDLEPRTRDLLVFTMREIIRRRGLRAAPVESSFADWPPED